jgi:hypothetical protein
VFFCVQCPAQLNMTVEQAAFVERSGYQCANSAGQTVSKLDVISVALLM